MYENVFCRICSYNQSKQATECLDLPFKEFRIIQSTQTNPIIIQIKRYHDYRSINKEILPWFVQHIKSKAVASTVGPENHSQVKQVYERTEDFILLLLTQ